MKWLVRIFLTIILIVSLFVLCGCSSENNNEDNNVNGYFTFVPVHTGKSVVLVPIWHGKEGN